MSQNLTSSTFFTDFKDIVRRLGALERQLGGTIITRIMNLESAIPYARVHRGTTQSITSATLTAVSFDTVVEDAFGMWNVGQPTRFTIIEAGVYFVGATARFDPNATGVRYGKILTNSTNTETELGFQAAPVADNSEVNPHTVRRYAVGDFIEFVVFQRSGGALNVATAAGNRPSMWIAKIGD